ncbi:hypothetical protein [Mycolicibacterium sp. P1-5]|uniref:hypothetical protein n=1 Tax=Mycolicibacterium sp. P1-5 TaxID=2024617 RepID=UPI0011EC66EC|nr:hypothetical protein [Mycolicibacterium sp. P1-5]KAA0101434.1 hypothetical protein CIW47_24930 [Mycolicibacterium sp. P1-5]
MNLARRVSASTASFLGYLLLLLAFTALGLFVADLASGSGVAMALFVGLVASLAGSVMGFRAASRKLSEAGVFIEATSPVSIFSAPLRQQQVDRYVEDHRASGRVAALPITVATRGRDHTPRRTNTERAERVLLSA